MRASRWAVAAVLVLGLAACGGDDDDSAATTSAEVATSADAAATTAGGTGTTSGEGADTTAGGGGGATTTMPSGDGDTRDDAADLVDVCALVTSEDVAAVVGEDPGPGTDTSYTPFSGCDYETVGTIVQISVLAYFDEAEAADSFEAAVEVNDYPLVEGVGDEAYDGAPAFGLTTRTGRYEAEVNVMSEADPATELEQEKALALVLVDRLP